MRPTASQLQRLDSCAYWARPEVTAPPDDSGPGALTGTAFHSLVAAALGAPMEPAPDGADERAAHAMFVRWGEWWGSYPDAQRLKWRPEVALAWDVVSGRGRVIWSQSHRDYSDVEPTEVAGTADAVALDGDCAVVLDWKTGASIENTTPAARNRQLAMLALALVRAKAFGATHARVALVHVSATGVVVDEAPLDEMDIDAYDDTLRELLASVPTSVAVPGSHCKWCPARTVCPAVESGALAVSGKTMPALAEVAAGKLVSPERLAEAWGQLAIVEAAVDAAKKRVRQFVEVAGPLPLPSGKTLRLVDVNGRETLSKASIVRALGKDDGTALLDRLRENGAIEVSRGYQQLKETLT